MFDSAIRPLIDPPLRVLGRMIAATGIRANQVTLVGLALGLGGAAAIALQNFSLGLMLILASRLADGLDGAVARIHGKTAFGGYLDIVSDFAFYAAVPVAFGIAMPEARLAALVLTASFILSGGSFLASAIIAAEQGWETRAQGEKSFYYLAGLAEGTETILFFCLFCLFPSWFAPLAWVFAAMCIATALGRTLVLRSSLESRS
jgi:phosphatidylglycerophosphate synthase